MLEEEVLNKYIAIDLLERYKNLSGRFSSKEVLEDFNKDKILAFLNELNRRFSYHSKEDFYELSEQEGDFDLKFNVSLKYGMVEPVFWGKNIYTGKQYGGALIRVTKQIQISMGVENVERIMYPRYKTVDDLRQILEGLYILYIDFRNIIREQPNLN